VSPAFEDENLLKSYVTTVIDIMNRSG